MYLHPSTGPSGNYLSGNVLAEVRPLSLSYWAPFLRPFRCLVLVLLLFFMCVGFWLFWVFFFFEIGSGLRAGLKAELLHF